MITKLQVKYIQSLGQKQFRDQAGVFVAEGPKIINEILAALTLPEIIFATRNWIDASSALLQFVPSDKIVEVKEHELERISFLQTPNQVLAVFEKIPVTSVQLTGVVSLMLDGIQDPGNMGTLIRIADWFGITTIICSKDCADAFAPKVVQGTMGSIMRVQLLYTGLTELVKEQPLLQLYAATLHGTPLHSLSSVKEGIVVIGNESKGISSALLEQCRHRITIPRTGKAESLNAAVAAGIILSHIIT